MRRLFQKLHFKSLNHTEISSHKKRSYRPDIDGLRAVAVISVVFFHAHFKFFGIEPFRGGYVGVDIFFVISGYLITGIILRELTNGEFSLARFYERRTRRILPALLLIVLTSIVMGLFVMTPAPFKEFMQSAFFVVIFLANVFFWKRDDYFSEPSEQTPLLHTWSLSIEEQFYVLFPLTLAWVWKNSRKLTLPFFVAAILASILLSIHAEKSDPASSFYLFQNRAWELLVGGLLASLPPQRLKLLSSLPSVGIILIVVSVCAFGNRETSVGWNTAFAVLGAALILFFGNGSDFGTRLLSKAPLVGIGLISYSFYLWHQPIFAFSRLYLINSPSNLTYLTLTAISLALAYLSWSFVELPFRNRNSISVKQLTISVATASAVVLLCIISSEVTGGFPHRFSNDQLALLGVETHRGTAIVNGRDCRRQSISDACIIGLENAKPTFAVLGDSHAETLTGPLSDLLKSLSLSAYVYTYPACGFITGVETIAEQAPCKDFEEKAIAAIRSQGISSVIINDRINAYILGAPFDNGEGGVEPGSISKIRPIGFHGTEAERITASAAALKRTLLSLLNSNIKIYYILPVPEVGWHVPRTIVKLIAQHRLPLTTSLNKYLERNWMIVDVAKELSKEKNFIPIYPHRIFCREDTKRCYTHSETKIFYTDTDHLSQQGAKRLVQVLAPEIKKRMQLRDAHVQ